MRNYFLLRKVLCRLSLRESGEEFALLSRSERRRSSQHRFPQQIRNYASELTDRQSPMIQTGNPTCPGGRLRTLLVVIGH
jgi:hypothetical protein